MFKFSSIYECGKEYFVCPLGKVSLVFTHRAVKMCGWRWREWGGDIAPHILNHGTKSRWNLISVQISLE